jgi:hypothetical protein
VCDEEPKIGDLVPDNCIIYRGCSRKNFLNSQRDAVAAVAFQKQGRNHKDGLSLALTAADSVKYLEKGNFGVIRISVQAIHQLNEGLQVRYDATDPKHVLIRNLPCMDRDEEKERALKLSTELAAIAEVESATPLPNPPPTTTQGTS